MLYEDPNGTEPSTFMGPVVELRTLLRDESTSKDDIVPAAQKMLQALYVDEIQKQLDMDKYKTAKKTPIPLGADVITNGTTAEAIQQPPSEIKATDKLWTPEESVAETVACLLEAHKEPKSLLQAFDKDDDLAMRWVTGTSNLRSHVFQIEPLQSVYSAKGIAGNIIPAIATTNAIVAGLQMIQVINILKAQLASGKKGGNLQECCQYVNCIRQSTRNGLYLTASKLNPPNPNCFVCRGSTLALTIDTKTWTLERFLERIVKRELGFHEPTLMLDGDIIWEEGEGADLEAFARNQTKTLSVLPCGGIHHGTGRFRTPLSISSFDPCWSVAGVTDFPNSALTFCDFFPISANIVLEIEDFTQDLQVNVAIAQQDYWEGEEYDNPEQRFVIGGEKPHKAAPVAAAAAAKPAETTNGDKKNDDSDSEIEAWDVGPDSKPAAAKKKRSLEKSDGGEKSPKRAKTNGGAKKDVEIEIIELE